MVRQLRPPYLNRFFSEATEPIKITFWVTRVVGLYTESRLFESHLWQQMKKSLCRLSTNCVSDQNKTMVKKCTKIEFSSIFYKALPKLTIIAPTHKGYLDDSIRLSMLPFSGGTKVGMNGCGPRCYRFLWNILFSWRELKFGIVSGNIWYSSQLKSQEMTLI